MLHMIGDSDLPGGGCCDDMWGKFAPADIVVEVFEFKGKEYIRADLAEQMSVPKEKAEGTGRKGGRRRRVKKQVDKTYVDDDGWVKDGQQSSK